MITYDMIKLGYERNLITIVYSDFAQSVVCYIGSFWFLFGGIAAYDAISVEEYKASVSNDEIIGAIYDALTEMKEDVVSIDEYRYYECYLNEQLFN